MIEKIYNFIKNNNVNEVILRHKTITEFKGNDKDYMFPITLAFDIYPDEKPFFASGWTQDSYPYAWDLKERVFKNFNSNCSDVDGGCGGGVNYQYEFNDDEIITFLNSLDFSEWDIDFQIPE